MCLVNSAQTCQIRCLMLSAKSMERIGRANLRRLRGGAALSEREQRLTHGCASPPTTPTADKSGTHVTEEDEITETCGTLLSSNILVVKTKAGRPTNAAALSIQR